MSYVDISYYTDTFRGEPVNETDFPSLCERASELVEEMCMHRISEQYMNSYPEDIQERIKKAVCAQIEYMDANGGSDTDNGADLQSAALGKFNYTRAVGSNGIQAAYAPRAIRIMAPTGFLYKGGVYY